MARSSASVCPAMVPNDAVVRSTVASWHTTSSPSAVACTSNSIAVGELGPGQQAPVEFKRLCGLADPGCAYRLHVGRSPGVDIVVHT